LIKKLPKSARYFPVLHLSIPTYTLARYGLFFFVLSALEIPVLPANEIHMLIIFDKNEGFSFSWCIHLNKHTECF
jgi:hypothetical protein